MRQDFLSVAFGETPFWTRNNSEISTRLLVALFFLAPLLFVTIETSPTAWAILAAISAAVSLTRDTKFHKSLHAPAIFLAVILLLVSSSLFWSIDQIKTWIAVRDMLGFSLAGLLLLNCLLSITEHDCSRLAKAFTYGSALAILTLVAIEAYLAAKNGQFTPAVDLITLHKITFYGVLFAIWLLCAGSTPFILLTILYAISTIAFGHSAGVGGAIIIVATLHFLSDRKRRLAFAAILLAYMIFIFVAPEIVHPVFRYLDGSGILSSYKPGTFAARLELWDLILNHIWSAPMLGHGANTIRNATWLITSPKYYNLQDLPSSHNIIVDVWFELGFTGIAFLCVSLIALSARIYSLSERSLFLCSSLFLTILIELSVDHRIWLSWVMGAIIMASTSGLIYNRVQTTLR